VVMVITRWHSQVLFTEYFEFKLSEFAKHIVAVELNRLLCHAADCNLSLNGISNVTIVPCDSEKFAKRILQNRSYISRDGTKHHFGGVLVDPPRAGLDPSTRRLIAGYDNIIYISCNPEALSRDLVEVMKVFDRRYSYS
jgi:tRNA (uracil-5-)-methyltransferase